MILFNKEDPLSELAGILNQGDPSGANRFHAGNIALDKIQSVDANQNDGYNTLAYVRTVGDENEAIGMVEIRFNRIDLEKYFPSYAVTVQATTNKGRMYPNELGTMFTKALGTKMETEGRYADYSRDPFNLNKGDRAKIPITIKSESLRYVPRTIYVYCYSLGKALDMSILDPGCTPFTTDAGGIEYTGTYDGWYENIPQEPDSNKRSLPATLGNLDFTSVWGEDPTSVIELTNDPELLKYRFNAEAFDKINDLLSVYGLPPLPDPYFNAYGTYYYDFYSYRTSTRSSPMKKYSRRICPVSNDPTVVNYGLRISHTDFNYNYIDVANIHVPRGQYVFYSSSKYGTGVRSMWDTHMFFSYQIK